MSPQLVTSYCLIFVIFSINHHLVLSDESGATEAPSSDSELSQNSTEVLLNHPHITLTSQDQLNAEINRWQEEQFELDKPPSPISHNSMASRNSAGETGEDLDAWEAPMYIRKNYPFYLTGFDEENRPIWVAEWGKFDLQKIALGGQEMIDAFDKYVRKTVRTIHKSHELRATPDHPVHQAAFIVDFDQLKLEQLADVRTITYALKLARENRDIIERGTSQVFIVNANYVAELAINLGRRALPRVFENVQVFGTNKAKWLPQIIRAFPQDQLPPWYGGPKDHKPLIVCG